MMRSNVIAAVLCCCLSPAVSSAEQRLRPGEQQMREAVDLMRQERCDAAIPLLLEAYEVSNSRQRNALWNLAECYVRVSRPGRAIDAYEQYLEHPVTQRQPRDQAEARQSIARLASSVATLSVECSVSGSRVLVDGHQVGIISRGEPLQTLVGAGLHHIEVSSPGFTPWSQEVQFEAGVGRTVNATLLLSPGELSIISDPAGATVHVDGQPLGRTPVEDMEVAGGSHSVSLELDGYRTWQRFVTLQPGEQSSLAATLEPTEGTLAVATDATNAQLFVEETERDESPFGPLSLSPGRYQVAVRSSHHADWSGTIDIIDGRVTSVDVALARTGRLHQGWFWLVAGSALASLGGGIALFVLGNNAADEFNLHAANIEAEVYEPSVIEQQDDGLDEASQARGYYIGGIVLACVAGLATLGAVLLGLRTQFRHIESSAEISSDEEETSGQEHFDEGEEP